MISDNSKHFTVNELYISFLDMVRILNVGNIKHCFPLCSNRILDLYIEGVMFYC